MPDVCVLWTGLDSVTAHLIVDSLGKAQIPASAVSRSFDGVTVGHLYRDMSVMVPKGYMAIARDHILAAWGKAAVDRLDKLS